jgi:diaminopimelate epimerase
MDIEFTKYHALYNDFLVVEGGRRRLTPAQLKRLAVAVCHRRSGVGADGVLYVTPSKRCDGRIDVYNADGSWAEKSGNGMRIVVMHEYLRDRRRKKFTFEMNRQLHQASVVETTASGIMVTTELGQPEFKTDLVPVKSRQRYMINAPLKLAGLEFPVTCLSVGNPHTVMVVENFDFDWQQLGAEIECHRSFPSQTNVEFVKPVTRRRLRVADWERGAGATGSSGTGAAAAVCAMVMLGAADRNCEVQFDSGSLMVNWREDTDIIELTGPVARVAEGRFRLP